MAKTTIDTLSSDIEKILDEYGDDVRENLVEITQKVGKTAVKALKSNPGKFGGSGDYSKGWTSKAEIGRLGATVIIHNAKLPGLPHLLEHGHALRNGGRSEGTVHIKTVEDDAIKSFESSLENKL